LVRWHQKVQQTYCTIYTQILLAIEDIISDIGIINYVVVFFLSIRLWLIRQFDISSLEFFFNNFFIRLRVWKSRESRPTDWPHSSVILMSCYSIVMRTARDRLAHCFGASERFVHTLPTPCVCVPYNITQWTSVETVWKHCFFLLLYYFACRHTAAALSARARTRGIPWIKTRNLSRE